MIGHPDIHRALKELVKFDVSHEESDLTFSKKLASVMLKNAKDCIDSRAVWVFVALLESPRTKDLVHSELKKNHLKFVKDQVAEQKSATGLKVLLKLLSN